MNLRKFALITCLALVPMGLIADDCCGCPTEQECIQRELDFQQRVEERFAKGLEELEKCFVGDLSIKDDYESLKKTTLEEINNFEALTQEALHVICRYLDARIQRSLTQEHEPTWDDTEPSECELERKAAVVACYLKHAPKIIKKQNSLSGKKSSEIEETLMLGFGNMLLEVMLDKIEKYGSLESDDCTYNIIPYGSIQHLVKPYMEQQYAIVVQLTFDQLRRYKQRTEPTIPLEQEVSAKAALIEWYHTHARDIIAGVMAVEDAIKKHQEFMKDHTVQS